MFYPLTPLLLPRGGYQIQVFLAPLPNVILYRGDDADQGKPDQSQHAWGQSGGY